MVHEGIKARPPRQRLTLELTALLATFMVVIGVWTRTVVIGEPTPAAAVPTAVRSAAHPDAHRHPVKLSSHHPTDRVTARRVAHQSPPGR